MSSREDHTTGRKRKIYSITGQGKKEHIAWLETRIEQSRHQDEGLLRLFFFDALPANKQIQVLENYLHDIKTQKNSLEQILLESKKAKVEPAQQKGFRFRMLAGGFGLEQMEIEIKFYRKIIQEIKKEDR